MIRLAALIKIRIAGLAAVSAAAGYFAVNGEMSPRLAGAVAGTFLLAAGAGALNQYQERRADRLMQRTSQRPLPAGELTPSAVLRLALWLLPAGLLLTAVLAGWQAALAGSGAVAWYNGVYTWLKKRTPFAAVPGALTGVFPPVLGALAGGGPLFQPALLSLMLFVFIWQIPHFWLLVLIYPGDQRRGGFRDLLEVFGSRQLFRIVFAWTFATCCSAMLLPFCGLDPLPVPYAALTLLGLWLGWQAAVLTRGRALEEKRLQAMFANLNRFALLTLLFAAGGRIWPQLSRIL